MLSMYIFTINKIIFHSYGSTGATAQISGMTVVQNIIVIYTRKEKYFSNMIMRNGIYHHRIIYSLNTLGCLCRYTQLNDFKCLNNIFFIFCT